MKKGETKVPGVLIMVTIVCALLYLAFGSIYMAPTLKGRVALSLGWIALAQLFVSPLIGDHWAIPYILKNGKRPINGWSYSDVHNVGLAREIAKARGEFLWFVWAYYASWLAAIGCVLAAVFLCRE